MGVETYDKKGDRPMFLRLLIAVRPCAAEDGQSLAEYGLILALVALVCVAGVTAIGWPLQACLATSRAPSSPSYAECLASTSARAASASSRGSPGDSSRSGLTNTYVTRRTGRWHALSMPRTYSPACSRYSASRAPI